MNFIDNYFSEVEKIAKLIDKKLIENLVEQLNALRTRKGSLYILGVGGSAGNCSHAVNDFRKLCHIHAFAPTDNVSELTARTNDEGWNTVFAEWLKISHLEKNDGILILSVGGGSKEKSISTNLIAAIDLAKSIGAKIFSIVGKEEGYAFQNSDISILIPTLNSELITPHSEEFQAVVWHCIVSHPTLKKIKTKW